MKEIEKKDLPGISGGQATPPIVIAPGGPITPLPYPQTPGGPIGPTDPYDPLGDGTHHKQS